MSEREKGRKIEKAGKIERREKSKDGKNRKTGKVVRYKANFSKNGGSNFFGTTTGIQILISRPYFFAGCTAISWILGYLTVQTFRFIR